MTHDAVDDRDRSTDAATDGLRDGTVPNPWTRVLGILVLGSFAAATKTTRKTARRSRRTFVRDDPMEAAA